MEMSSIFLNKILSEVASQEAAGVHLAVGSAPMLRQGDKLFPIGEEEILTEDKINKLLEDFLSSEELEQLKKEKELITVKNFFNKFRFRVNIFYQKNYPTLAFHYISEDIPNLDNLSLPDLSKKVIRFSAGLVIVTGPNNSGKTTTAVSMIEKINQEERRYVVTLERPVERLFVNKKSIVNQREVGRDVKSYKDGLLNCLEEDVDVVYVGGIKEEFASNLQLLLDLAAGNCLVILEMDTKNSVRTIEKILNVMQKSKSLESSCYMLADTLLAIFSQKLIPNKEEGLSLALEVLLVNTSVKSIIRDNKIYQLESVMQNFEEEGMISMTKSIKELVRQGKIKEEEVQKLNLDIEV